MATLNRLIRIISVIVIAALVVALGAGIWAVYRYIPQLKGRIGDATAQAVAQWFPLGENGEFSYDLDIKLHPRECKLIDFSVSNGSGKVLRDLQVDKYDLKAAAISIDLDDLLKNQQANMTGMEGVEFHGDILLADLGAYYVSEKSGIKDIGMEYDDFTEKVILRFDVVEPPLGRIVIEGKVSPTGDKRGITLAERRYYNIEGPLPEDLVKVVEGHTNLDIEFAISDFPLTVKKISLTKKSLSIELER